MSSQDDPEERIRQLEQSAAGYGTVEYGEQYTTPTPDPTAPLPPPVYPSAPPPPGTYGVPPVFGDTYSSPPPPPSSPPFGVAYPEMQKKGAPVGLIFGGALIFVLLLFGVIGVVVWQVIGKTGSISTEAGGETSFSRPGGKFDEPSSRAPTTRRPTTSAPVIVPSFPDIPGILDEDADSAPPGGNFSVSGIDGNRTIACNDAKITISGINNTVVLTGHCASVTVSGVENNVTVDNADVISASGFDNRITYKSGDPQIDNFGGSNTVEKG